MNGLCQIEPFIEGEYKKFSSNTGYENPDFTAYIPAFSHLSWIISRGKRVIMDIQGVFKDGKYILTDPAVQSFDFEFGNSDLGPFGILQFLSKHKHNNICEKWKWIPKNVEMIIKSKKVDSKIRTTFSFEIQNINYYRIFYLNILNSVKFV